MAWVRSVDNSRIRIVEWDADIPLNADWNPPDVEMGSNIAALYWQKQVDAGTDVGAGQELLQMFEVNVGGTTWVQGDSLRWHGRDGVVTAMGDGTVEGNSRAFWELVWDNGDRLGPPLMNIRIITDWNKGTFSGTRKFDEFRYIAVYK